MPSTTGDNLQDDSSLFVSVIFCITHVIATVKVVEPSNFKTFNHAKFRFKVKKMAKYSQKKGTTDQPGL